MTGKAFLFAEPDMALLKKKSAFTRKAPPANSIATRKKETPVYDEEPAPPPRKPKREVAVVDPLLEERPEFMSKTQYNKIISAFGQGAPAIIQMLDRNNNDGALTAINRTLMQTLLDILPLSENVVRRSEGTKGLYQFHQTIAQIRELSADIQSLQDKGMMGTRIVERYVRPLLQSLAQQIVLSFTIMGTEARKVMKPEDYQDFERNVIRKMQFSLADFMQKQFDAIEKDIAQAMS